MHKITNKAVLQKNKVKSNSNENSKSKHQLTSKVLHDTMVVQSENPDCGISYRTSRWFLINTLKGKKEKMEEETVD